MRESGRALERDTERAAADHAIAFGGDLQRRGEGIAGPARRAVHPRPAGEDVLIRDLGGIAPPPGEPVFEPLDLADELLQELGRHLGSHRGLHQGPQFATQVGDRRPALFELAISHRDTLSRVL
ncbi:hypothetical protein [Glycomyces buryatensis]|uniref:hypothetical protein n=1 Tax=Glycomyces buryatensis TaxID=2570927 RepID=UPI001FE5B2AF|nr:hypothetical protein [Glycomyces buryatensis]